MSLSMVVDVTDVNPFLHLNIIRVFKDRSCMSLCGVDKRRLHAVMKMKDVSSDNMAVITGMFC